jgi:3-dehydroquinate synthase
MEFSKLIFSFDDFRKLIDNQSVSSVFVISDSNTSNFCLPFFRNNVNFSFSEICIPANEENKNISSCLTIFDSLTISGADRNSLILNLGGGMVTDLGGFCASVFKRGLRFINIPTTLMAMVDAAHGGKTGIDYKQLKNEIGTFSMPLAVFIIPELLNSLPLNQFLSGKSEMLKHEIIGFDEPDFDFLNAEIPDFIEQERYIQRSIEIKTRFFTNDVYDSGSRQALNFGHTLGHAIESYFLKQNRPLLHGEAIAAGIEMELFLSVKKLDFPIYSYIRIKTLLKQYFKKLDLQISEYKYIESNIKHDKKNIGGQIIFSLVYNFGRPATSISCSLTDIKEAFESYCHG